VKIVRVPFAVSLALLAAAPALAAVAPPPPPKPPAEGGVDSDRDARHDQGVAVCVAQMHGAEGVTADEIEATCGCALDRYLAGQGPDGPPLVADQVRTVLGGPLLACASTQRPAVAPALARRLAAPPSVDAPPLVGPDETKPPETPEPAPADAPKRSEPDFRTWLSGLSLPAWLTGSGLPTWAWILLAFFGFLLLRGLFRGGDGRDLIGPPPSMRLGARANPPAPRRADPPQRG
jgi:hypothetical protein